MSVAGAVIAADQITKTLAIDHLSDGPVHLFGPASFELAFNSGVAFSLFTGYGLPIVLLAACLVVGVVWFSRGIPSVSASIALGLVSGGAFGNLADRIFRHDGGAVVDFIHVGVWPTFNVADSAIVCGTALLVVVFLRADHALEPRGSGEHGG